MAKNFKKHMMYDPKTGEGYMANTYDDHVRMNKKGYVHEKPKPPFKSTYNIATGGTTGTSNPWLTSVEAKAGEGEYLGGFPDWTKVSDAKTTLTDIMNHQEKMRKIKKEGKENKETPSEEKVNVDKKKDNNKEQKNLEEQKRLEEEKRLLKAQISKSYKRGKPQPRKRRNWKKKPTKR